VAKIVGDAVRQPITGVLMDQDAADFTADQYLAGDRQAIAGFARSPQNLTLVRQAIQKKAKEQGLSGVDLALKMAEYHGLVSAETGVAKRAVTIEMFADETLRVINVAERASKDVPRGQFIPFNRAMLAFEKNTGDPNVVALGQALQAVVNTYAKAISGGQQATVSDKAHAREQVEIAYSSRQMGAVYDMLKMELQAAKAAPGDVKKGLSDLFKGKNDTPTLSDPNVIKYKRDADGKLVRDTQ